MLFRNIILLLALANVVSLTAQEESSLSKNHLFPVYRSFNECGYANAQNKMVIDYQYDECGLFQDFGLARVSKDNLKGLINTEGVDVFDKQVNSIRINSLVTARHFSKGNVQLNRSEMTWEEETFVVDASSKNRWQVVKTIAKSDKPIQYGLLDSLGNLIWDFKYDYIRSLGLERFHVKKDSINRVVDLTEQVVFEGNYKTVQATENFYHLLCENGKYSLRSNENEVIFDCELDQKPLRWLEDSLMVISKDQQIIICDYTGKTILKTDAQKIQFGPYSGEIFASIRNNKLYGLSTISGKQITKEELHFIKFEENYISALATFSTTDLPRRPQEHRYYGYDGKLMFTTPYTFPPITNISRKDRRNYFLFFNLKNEMVLTDLKGENAKKIPYGIVFNSIADEESNLPRLILSVSDSGKDRYYDTSKGYLDKYYKYDKLFSIGNEWFAYQEGSKNKERYGLINLSKDLVLPAEYDFIEDPKRPYGQYESPRWAIYYKEGRKGFFDTKYGTDIGDGIEKVQTVFLKDLNNPNENIHLEGAYTIILRSGKNGVVDSLGNYVFEAKYDKLYQIRDAQFLLGQTDNGIDLINMVSKNIVTYPNAISATDYGVSSNKPLRRKLVLRYPDQNGSKSIFLKFDSIHCEIESAENCEIDYISRLDLYKVLYRSSGRQGYINKDGQIIGLKKKDFKSITFY